MRKEKDLGGAARIGVFGREKKEDSRKGDFFSRKLSARIGERRGRKEYSFGGFRVCLEEKHRGKDWQHASSSHLKPSNSSQRLVLPGMVM